MKNFSIQADKAYSTNMKPPEHQPLTDLMKAGVRNLLRLFSRMGTAIALGEKGDLEGAKKLREEYVKQ